MFQIIGAGLLMSTRVVRLTDERIAHPEKLSANRSNKLLTQQAEIITALQTHQNSFCSTPRASRSLLRIFRDIFDFYDTKPT
jgi:hypothetical protein